MTRALGLVDLLTLFEHLPEARVARLAAYVGFDAPEGVRGEAPPSVLDVVEQLSSDHLIEIPSPPRPPPQATAPRDDITYWRAERFEPTEDAVTRAPSPPPAAPLTRAEATGGASARRGLGTTPLTPWPRLGPLLHQALGCMQPGSQPDVKALVWRWSRGESLRRVPRRRRRAWAARVTLWHDRSHRLIPFWSDQDHVERQLRAVLGRDGLAVTLLDPATPVDAIAAKLASDGTTLVLGDLGLYGPPTLRAAWRRALLALQRRGVDVTALVPASRARLGELDAMPARVLAWDWRRGTPADEPTVTAARSAAVERLLRLASMAGFVEPALLRSLRLVLPAHEADAATEAALWRDPDVYAPDSNGLVVRPERLDHWRGEFAKHVAPEVMARVAEAITRHHAPWAEELLHAETVVWASHVPVTPPGDLTAATAFVARVTAASCDGSDAGWAEEARAWGRSFLQTGLDDAVYERIPGLQRLWASAFRGLDVRVPRLIDRPALDRELGLVAARKGWSLRQVGGALVLAPVSPVHGHAPGSFVSTVTTTAEHLTLREGKDATQRASKGTVTVPLRRRATITVGTDEGALTVTPWTPGRPERWMSATGRDAFGLWAEFTVGAVTHRLRWIPPGRFWMGSPEGEAGRFDWEGPRHEVALTSGYWLGETPVTQALWEAVMGNNPSRFPGAERPVEQVSWHECVGFMGALEGMVPGLGARLPTEAEWERACRAGTEGATWLGSNDEATLDVIAWWGGNSGGETHPVRLKAANPYGLYDMLGNVEEWCGDAKRTYGEAPVRDPYGPLDSPLRVFRGGSWHWFAWIVRAAYRGANSPTIRVDDLGLRLARGQGLRSSPSTQSGAAERPPAPGRGTRPGEASSRDAATPTHPRR